jgi:peptidoglycan/LPS O-acetylase OafA/YrhL
MRGIAVLSVVFFHSFENYFPYGYLGVDAFFVISGFVVAPLILNIFEKSEVTGGGVFKPICDFYLARVYRLAPALFAALVFSILIFAFFGSLDVFHNISMQSLFTLLMLGNYGSYKLSGNYFLGQPPLNHTWSISVEAQIYIFMPLFIALIFYKRNFNIVKLFKWIVFLTIISLVLFKFGTSFFHSWTNITQPSDFIFYSPFTRVWQFTIGFLGFIIKRELSISKSFLSKKFGFIILITGIVVIYASISKSHIYNSILISLWSLIFIFYESLKLLPKQIINAFEWFGDRSYSIYLYHMPLIYLAKNSPLFLVNDDYILRTLSAILITLLIASISFSKVENRFRLNKYKISTRKKLKGIAYLFLSSLFLSLLLYTLSRSEFFSFIKLQNSPPNAGVINQDCLNGISTNRPICKYELAGANKTVILFGDSFAGAISSAFITAAKSQNINLVTSYTNGCALNFSGEINEQNEANCFVANANTLEYINLNRPNLVVVSYYMNQYLEQEIFKESLLKMKSIVPNLLLIENVPVFPDENTFMRIGTIFTIHREFSRSFPEYSMKNKGVSDSLSVWASNHDIDTLSFYSVFCENGMCTRFENSNFLYTDNKHLSIYGAKKTIPIIDEYLSKLK